MTRAQYERLGNWCELLGPWEMLEEERMSEEIPPWAPVQEQWDQRRTMDEWFAERTRHRWTDWQKDCARAIARTLLTETSLTPSQVRERWPEDAGWLLEGER